MEKLSAAERGSKQLQDKKNATKIDTPVPAPPIRRQRRNAFGSCSAPVSPSDDSPASPAIPAAYPAVRPATPGTCRTAHIAAQGSARSKRLSSGLSPGQTLSPLRTRVPSPPIASRSVYSPVRRRPTGPEGVQLPYAHARSDTDTEPFPRFIDSEILPIELPRSSTSQPVSDNLGGQSGVNAASASSASLSQQWGALSIQEGRQTPPRRSRSESRTVIGSPRTLGYIPPDTDPSRSPQRQ